MPIGDLRRPAVGRGLDHASLEVDDRLLQHRLVKLEADLLDVAGLFFAEQIAGAADIEIVRSKLEAGAQRFQRLQHLQPPLGLRRDLLLCRQREQRIGAQLRPPHPSAQLIELRQAKHVGAVHDQRIGVRNIEAGLDDGGRQQDIVFAVIEGRHDVFDHGRRHLAVRDRDLHFRHVLFEEILDAGEVFDPRHDIERLPAAITFAQQRLADHQGIVRRDEGAHRQPIDRRRGNDGQFAHARERQLQRARDRRCAQRQHMHFGAQLFQPLLVADAEMLLFIDDQKAEVTELDRFAEQRMGADHDVDRAVRQTLFDLREFFGRDQARGLRHVHRKAAKPLGEGFGMLARQQGRRHDDGNLLAVERGGKGRAQGDLGLAEADVAADQPVHRPAGLEILQGRMDGAESWSSVSS